MADDDPLTRRMVCRALDVAGLTVVAQAGDGREAVELTLRLRPDMVFMDVLMPRCDGLSATRQLALEAPEIEIVILSVIDDEELELLALRCGASGFINKAVDLKALPRVVRGVGKGEAAIKRTLARRLIGELRRAPEPVVEPLPTAVALSPREQQVLDLLAEGHTTESIARELDLTLETVRGYIKGVLRKLRVHTRHEAVELRRPRRHEDTAGVAADIAAALGQYAS